MPDILSQAAIVIDVDAQHVTSLVESPVLREYQIGGDKHANLVVHRVTTAVTRDPRYVEWASKFDEKTEVCIGAGSMPPGLTIDSETLQHVVAIIDKVDDAITYTSSSWNLLRLNMLDKDIFKPQVVEKLEKEKAPACRYILASMSMLTYLSLTSKSNERSECRHIRPSKCTRPLLSASSHTAVPILTTRNLRLARKRRKGEFWKRCPNTQMLCALSKRHLRLLLNLNLKISESQ